MDWEAPIVFGIILVALACLLWIGLLLERIHKRQIAMQRYLRRTERTMEKAELHLRLIKGYMQDQSIIGERERTEETEATLRAYDNIEEAFDRDVQDQRFGGGPPENQ